MFGVERSYGDDRTISTLSSSSSSPKSIRTINKAQIPLLRYRRRCCCVVIRTKLMSRTKQPESLLSVLVCGRFYYAYTRIRGEALEILYTTRVERAWKGRGSEVVKRQGTRDNNRLSPRLKLMCIGPTGAILSSWCTRYSHFSFRSPQHCWFQTSFVSCVECIQTPCLYLNYILPRVFTVFLKPVRVHIHSFNAKVERVIFKVFRFLILIETHTVVVSRRRAHKHRSCKVHA